jgi:hypothetical protein
MPTDLDRSVSACAAARNLWVEPQDMKSLMSARGDNRHAKPVRQELDRVQGCTLLAGVAGKEMPNFVDDQHSRCGMRQHIDRHDLELRRSAP